MVDDNMRVALVLKLVLGGLLAFIGLSCAAIGAGMRLAPLEADQAQAGTLFFFFGVVIFLIPGSLLLWAGLRGRAYDRRLSQVIAMGRAASRLPMQEVAAQLGITPMYLRKLILEAIAKGKMAGRMDYEHGVFISDVAHQGVQQLSLRCPACGGVSEVIVTAGAASSCEFCGQRVA